MDFPREACVIPHLSEKTCSCQVWVWRSPTLDLPLRLGLPCPALPCGQRPSMLLCPWREGDRSCLQMGQGWFLSPDSTHFSLLPSPRLLSWKLLSEVEIRTVKGRESWCGEIPGQIRETRSLTQIELLPQEWPYAGFYLEATLSISLPAFPCSWDTLSL